MAIGRFPFQNLQQITVLACRETICAGCLSSLLACFYLVQGGLLDAEGYVLECDGPNPTFWDVWQLLAATPAPRLEPFDESSVSNGWWQQQIETISSGDKGSTTGGNTGTDSSASDYGFNYVPYR